jgi:hypothetical protein
VGVAPAGRSQRGSDSKSTVSISGKILMALVPALEKIPLPVHGRLTMLEELKSPVNSASNSESNHFLGVCDAAEDGWSTPKQQSAAHSAADLVCQQPSNIDPGIVPI